MFDYFPLGDSALVAKAGDDISAETNRVLRGLYRTIDAARSKGVVDLVPSYNELLISFDPAILDFAALLDRVRSLESSADKAHADEGRLVELPVLYGGDFGPDLADVAAARNLSEEECVRLHSSIDYPVYMLGFLPGFAYLGGLDKRLASPRRAVPRVRVLSGSVGIAEDQTGIYPVESPGGWNIIGRTPVKPFDPSRDPEFLFRAGDRVRFVPISRDEYDRLVGGAPAPEKPEPATEDVAVISPGAMTTIQDLGRIGYRSYGMPASGAFDPVSLRIANLLVGNEAGAAALETTLVGPELRIGRDCVVAVCGADQGPRINGRSVPMYAALSCRWGDVLSLSASRGGCRSYIAFSGGLDLPVVMGSRSTNLRAALGGYRGRALKAGDSLALASGRRGPKRRDARTVFVPDELRLHPADVAILRVLPGPEAGRLSFKGLRDFLVSEFRVDSESDRMGIRFSGPPIHLSRSSDIVSAGVCPGTIQLPSSGKPIALGADGQTTGGYSRIAVVASVDLPALAQLRPGDALRFREIDSAAAGRLAVEREALMRELEATR